MKQLFPTQEIGSLQKPSWRVKGLQGLVNDKDLSDLKEWYTRLNLQSRLNKVIKIIDDIKKEKENVKLSFLKQGLMEESQIFAIKFFEEVGLDIIYDGEQTRVEMYEDPISDIQGFEFKGLVRAFDVMQYKKAACIDEPKFKKPYHLEEYKFIKKQTKHDLKVPITGAYTLAEWSYNEFYGKNSKRNIFNLKGSEKLDRTEMALKLAKNVINPNIKSLVDNGAEWVQIDEPAATTYPDEVDLVVETFNESIRGLDVKASIHICFSDYSKLFPALQGMKNCHQYAWEFANTDSSELGTSKEIRKGYKILDLFNEYKVEGNIGLGVINVHSDIIESPELIRDRILYAAQVLGNERIFVNPDCGLRTRKLNISFEKLKSMTKGADLAREVFK